MKINTTTVHKVDYYNFEKFVEETYGRNPEVIASLECSNDSSHEFLVAGEVYSWQQEYFDKWLSGDRFTINPGVLLNYMARSELIPMGHYILWVSW